MKKLSKLILIMAAIPFYYGCSVGMALVGDKERETSVLVENMPRNIVIEKLGEPNLSFIVDGLIIDSYEFKEGDSPDGKRALKNLMANIVRQKKFRW